MDDKLLGIVLGRLEKYPLADEPADLLLAAFESEESLRAQLSDEATGRPAADPAGAAAPEPAGAYLQSLTVSGFRGIGEPATLRLQPGPGLAVVVGRNGSGKSSFAEALEVLLTGQLRRWEKLSAVWRQGWRSMHHPRQARITAEFLVEGAGPAVVQRTWPDGADFANSSVYVQFRGEKRAGLEQLGWSAALADHRPFLAHAEIEAFFGSPSGLYELLASVLGLEDLNAAATRLRQARLSRESAFKEVTKSLRDLLIRLEGRLRRLAQLTVPAEDEIRDATTMLREAATGLEAVAGSSAGRARALAALLTAALQHHEAHGDGDCPVCGRPGALSGEWRQATEAEVARLGQEAQDAEGSERAAAGARRHALTLVQPSPPVLSEAAPWGVDPGPALAAWAKWAAVPDPGAPLTAAGLRALAGHLEQAEPIRSFTAGLAAGPPQAALRARRTSAEGPRRRGVAVSPRRRRSAP